MNTQEKQILISTEDNVKIVLWKLYTEENSKNNILLIHGTFSNKKVFSGISEYFVNLGYTCWIVEWRNHGNSTKTKKRFNFETIAEFDIKSVLDYLIHSIKLPSINSITHSGGGIVLTLALIKNKEYGDFIKSITMFSCQAFGAVNSKVDYLKILISKYFSYLLGYVPGKILGLGEHNESYYTMKQWFDWNLKKDFIGENNIDFLVEMKSIKIAVLSICAKGDTFIAPQQGCEKFINSFDNENNKLTICSIENGFKEDYNHSRVILSKNASKEVWVLAQNWIIKHQDL